MHLRFWFFPLSGCLASLICFFFNSPGRQLVTIYSAFALMLLLFFFFKSRNRRWIRVQTQARPQHKIFNQKQVHAARYSSSVTQAEASMFQTGQMTGKMFCTRKKQKIKGKMLQKGNPDVHNWIYYRVLFGLVAKHCNWSSIPKEDII